MSARVVSAVIESVHGTNPGPASGITYTLRINTESGPMLLAGVRPHNARPGDGDAIDIRAASPGTYVIGVQEGQYFMFTIIEHEDSAPCP